MILSAIATLALAMMGDEGYEPDLLDLLGERCDPEGADELVKDRNEAEALSLASYKRCLGRIAKVHAIGGVHNDEYVEMSFEEGAYVLVEPSADVLRIQGPGNPLWNDGYWDVTPTPKTLERFPELALWSSYWITPKSYGFLK